MTSIKHTIKSLLPNLLRKAIQKHRYEGLSTEEVFAKIYREHAWGGSNDPTLKFFSGAGSHDPAIVNPYVDALQRVLSSLSTKPSVVDLGCGDFSVGSRIRYLCNSYIACDIVESLIDYNKHKYKTLDVDFRVLNLAKDDLPKADIAFIRQVLQHLSNEEIRSAIPQLASQYGCLVLTEHLPEGISFTHNRDKPTGPYTRLGLNSGVVLTSPPFNLKIREHTCICEVRAYGGTIKSDLYKLT